MGKNWWFLTTSFDVGSGFPGTGTHSGFRVPRNGNPQRVPGSQEREPTAGSGFPGTGTHSGFRVPRNPERKTSWGFPFQGTRTWHPYPHPDSLTSKKSSVKPWDMEKFQVKSKQTWLAHSWTGQWWKLIASQLLTIWQAMRSANLKNVAYIVKNFS